MAGHSLTDLFGDKVRTPEKSLTDLVEDIASGEEKPSSLSELSEKLEKDLSVSESSVQQFEYIRENYPSIDPETDCGTLGGSVSPTSEIEALLDKVGDMGPRMQELLNEADEKDILVCQVNDDGYNGFHVFEEGIVAINPNSRTPVRTAIEEFVHVYQDVPRLDMHEYTLPDFNLWKLGIEAQAKLSVAVEAVRQKLTGENEGELFNQHERGAHFAAAKFLEQQVQEQGLQALENPQVLYEAFEKIMGHSEFTASYIARSIPGGPGLDQSVGAKQFEADAFVKFMGTVIGGDPANNFLEGMVDSKDDLMELLPKGSQLAIQLQIKQLPESNTWDGVASEPVLK